MKKERKAEEAAAAEADEVIDRLCRDDGSGMGVEETYKAFELAVDMFTDRLCPSKADEDLLHGTLQVYCGVNQYKYALLGIFDEDLPDLLGSLSTDQVGSAVKRIVRNIITENNVPDKAKPSKEEETIEADLRPTSTQRSSRPTRYTESS